jgi:ketosteroid isomerase-like protein
MSKNSELIRAGYEAWNRNDLDAWLEVLHPDVEFHTSGVWPDFDPVYRGREGLADFWRRMHEPWEKFRIEVDQIDEQGLLRVDAQVPRRRSRQRHRCRHAVRQRDSRARRTPN